jgi:hypothetical protein
MHGGGGRTNKVGNLWSMGGGIESVIYGQRHFNLWSMGGGIFAAA